MKELLAIAIAGRQGVHREVESEGVQRGPQGPLLFDCKSNNLY
jgi:hypothetical protein